MSTDLKVALVQADLVWENPEQNRLNFTTKIAALSETVDLIILPEMFTSGFTMQAKKVAETMQGTTISWMKATAVKYNAAIVGSLVIEENKAYYNRLVFVTPEGGLTYYNKRHSFTLVGEQDVYKSGDKKEIINYKGWNICPLICYDLRFPVWSRNVEHYDVLLYVANWPKPRISAWTTLLKARAIENMSYVIGVNRVGKDGVNATYNGNSACYNVLGESISQMPLGEEACAIVTLSKSHVTKYRNKFKFLDDKDRFNLLN